MFTISNSIISGNTASDGGGIENTGILAIVGSTISANLASDGDGGGIYNANAITVSNSTISGNTADNGGGISNSSGTMTILNSMISGNSALEGGGIVNSDTMTVSNSTISENSASFDGGGISNDAESGILLLTISNSTISGNSAGRDGGGISNDAESGTITVNNSTITGNVAGRNGGGIDNTGLLFASLRSTIVANNDALSTGDELSGLFRIEYSLIERRAGATLRESVPGSNRYGIDPRLGPLAENGGPTLTHALLPGSSAINRGFNSAPQSFDQRGVGFVRAVSRIDIGAFEFQQKGSYLVPDLTNPTKRQMIVVGSQLKDTISVAIASGKLSVTINGLKRSYAVANIVGIVVRGNDGDDTITLANTVTIGGILDGGFGDDILTGSVGNDLLLGGEGDDKLLGVGGKDVLIGGDGHDSLAGGLADDLLIGGATVYDNSPAALLAILSEWTSLTNNYATRTQNLRQGLTVAPRLSATEIFDGFYDELTADTGATGGLELLFYDEFDLLTGVSAATEQAVLVQ